MNVTRISDAKPYEAPGHHGMSALRLQGFDATPSEAFWVGLSHFLPGGGVQRSATQLEKVYVMLAGELTFITDDGEQTLRPLDSCRFAPGEARAVENRGHEVATMLVLMPYPPGEA